MTLPTRIDCILFISIITEVISHDYFSLLFDLNICSQSPNCDDINSLSCRGWKKIRPFIYEDIDPHDLKVIKTKFLNTIGIENEQYHSLMNNISTDIIYSIENVYIDNTGQVYDKEFLFLQSHCGTNDIPFNDRKVVFMNETVLNLTSLWTENIFHGLLDLFSKLLRCSGIINNNPDIKIIISSKINHEKFWPILKVFGIELDIDKHQLVILTHGYVIHAASVITPCRLFCGELSKSAVYLWRHAIQTVYNSIPQFQHSDYISIDRNIVVYDHVIPGRSGRYLVQGSELRGRLKDHFSSEVHQDFSTYGCETCICDGSNSNSNSNRNGTSVCDDVFARDTGAYKKIHKQKRTNIKHLIGNETLLETLSLLRDCQYLVGVHGAGLVNMLFLPKNATVIEIEPLYYKYGYFIPIAMSLSLNHYIYGAHDGGQTGPVNIDVDDFVAHILPLID